MLSEESVKKRLRSSGSGAGGSTLSDPELPDAGSFVKKSVLSRVDEYMETRIRMSDDGNCWEVYKSGRWSTYESEKIAPEERVKAHASLRKKDPCDELLTCQTVEWKFKYIWLVKGIKSFQDIALLDAFTYYANNPAQQVQFLSCIVHALLNESFTFLYEGDCMPLSTWKMAAGNMFLILDLLKQYPLIIIDCNASFGGTKYKDDEVMLLQGNLPHYIDRLNIEFHRSVQWFANDIDKNYSEWLQTAEPMLIALSQNFHSYLERKRNFRGATKVALTLLELVHYQIQVEYDERLTFLERVIVDNHQAGGTPRPFIVTPKLVQQQPTSIENCRTLIDSLVSLISKHNSERKKTHALLFDVYHNAITDNFSASTGSLMKIPAQKCFPDMGYVTQIYFNRAIAQLGLCAFRLGLVEEAHSFLSPLFTGGRVKKLLAQRDCVHDKTQEQKDLIRRCNMPAHMHINLQLLEAVHLLCCVCVEVGENGGKSKDTKGTSESVEDHVSAPNQVVDIANLFDIIMSLDLWKNPEDGGGEVMKMLFEWSQRRFINFSSHDQNEFATTCGPSEAESDSNVVSTIMPARASPWTETLAVLAKSNEILFGPDSGR